MQRPNEIRTCIVCVNVTCLSDGSQDLVEALMERLEGSGVEVKTEICLGACGLGPNMVLHPRGTWLSAVKMSDVDDIVAHIKGSPAPDRLLNHVEKGLQEMILSILDAGL